MSVKPGRIAAIDAFRGFTVAGMIMVNNPGGWGAIYAPLRHAEWHGCTPTDLVFPFFLFIVGMASFFSFKKFDFELTSQSFFKILKRTVLIFVIGLALAAYPFVPKSMASGGVDYSGLRIFGVLQRIALAYFLGVSICLLLKKTKTLVMAGSFLMLLFWGILCFISPNDPYHQQNNACRNVDVVIPGEDHVYRGNWANVPLEQLIITPVSNDQVRVVAISDLALDVSYVRLSDTESYSLIREKGAEGLQYKVVPKDETITAEDAAYKVLPEIKRARLIGLDPEGLLGVLSAAATVIFGFLVGRLISEKSKISKSDVVLNLFLFGLPIAFLGMLWGQWFPINKPLWTGSYVLYTGGLAMVILAFFIWLMDVKERGKWFKPFVEFGSNPLFLFVLAGVIAKTLSRIKIDGLGTYQWLYQNVYSHLGSHFGSLIQAITFIVVMWLIAHYLYKNKIYIKV
ncbi:MAG: heparan-alpha-glucosaminide N-acetyltransferase domain-containing protein [Prevotellaceae bacterium]|jgi:predicted acyltransferase|nr:heparan-alpha-glucosaminide N-acetyltransferase domain-containing protein [Prevotellaceae bacterium]